MQTEDQTPATPAPPAPFRFALGQPVRIRASGETGKVTGRAEYSNVVDKMYMLAYVNAQGIATEGWWQEGDIVAV